MKSRLVILLVVAVGMGVFLLVRSKTPPGQEPELKQNLTAEQLEHYKLLKMRLSERPLPGEEPPEPADVRVTVEVDSMETKHRLYLYLSETHGYYVETLNVDIYRVTRDEQTGEQEQQWIVSNPFEIYLEADQILRTCIELVPSEMERIDNDLGTSEDWVAEVASYGRARVENPDPLPPLPEMFQCR